ncbi:MAG: helix-turn-helix domain-containing protein [Rhizobiales bacterium]|nr:helix-turn-helix domain-containing protein [Hyphomicrobiales bacterium]
MQNEHSQNSVHISLHRGGLQRRVFPLATGDQSILLTVMDGTAVLHNDGIETALQAPVLHWVPKASNARLVVEAGTAVEIVLLPEETLLRAIGDFSISADLHATFNRALSINLEHQQNLKSLISSTLNYIQREENQPQMGSDMMIVAHVRLLLVSIMRAYGITDREMGGLGSNARGLQRFRQLLEANFRRHWTVSAYADQLGMSPDRLHAICTRDLGKPPKALIDERVAREASRGLERSSLSIEQLAYSLGFREPAYFNQFFKRLTGIPPGRYRKMLQARDQADARFAPATFADWP